MEKQEVKSKWDELARQLGAQITPEVEQLVESSAEFASDVESGQLDSGEVLQAPMPKRQAAGWDSLASEFGLPIPEPLTSDVDGTPTESGKRVSERVEPADKPKRERRKPEHREAPSKRREPRSPHDERAVEREGDERLASTEPSRATAPPTPTRDEPLKPPAVSLWQKIFGVPADQAAKSSEPSSDDEQPPATIPNVDSISAGDERSDFDRSFADADFQDIDDRTAAAVSESTADDGEETERTARRRPRRRRRGHGSKARHSEGDDARDIGHRHRRPDRAVRHEEQESDSRTRPLGSKHPEGGTEAFGSRPSVDDDELDDLADSAMEMTERDEVTTARSRSALQRSIPSWEEAIGYIVDSNMQSRSQRRPSAHSGSRSNPSHGRGRGRRKT
jgi:hypothetical protein